MGSGFLNVGISGLNAAQMGILTASHNIANASTDGYHRQSVQQTTNTPMFTGGGFLGQGTRVETIQRVYDDFLMKQVMSAETSAAELDAYFSEIRQIDSLLADPSAGVSPSLQAFFAAMDDVASNPTSIPARQALLSAGQVLASRFQALDQQLEDIRGGVNAQIMSEVTEINSLATQIAETNQRIILAQASGLTHPANDLLDQRDTLLADLNKEVKVTTQVETDGSYSVFFGNGQPLVVGTLTYQLKAVAAPEDLTEIEVALLTPTGQQIRIPQSLITGGKLAGLLQFRSETLNVAQNSLGRIAMAVTETMNDQHRLGQDLNGDTGTDFFAQIAPNVLGASTNTGSATVAASIEVSDYRLTYNGTDYEVTRLSDNTKTTHTILPLMVDGVRISLASGTLAGTALNPDVFVIRPGALPDARIVRMSGNPDTAMLATTGSNLQILGTSDFRLSLSATNTFTLIRLSDDTAWSASGASQTAALSSLMNLVGAQGFSLGISGSAAVGDSFLVRPMRFAARDMAMSITDARDIAAGLPFRTGASLGNGGTGTITAGEASSLSVPLSANVNIRYEAASNSFTGFPVGATVTVVGSTSYKITGEAMRVPYTAGATLSVNGVAFSISGAPADGDAFTIKPSPTAPSVASNGGLSTMFGVPAAGNRGASRGNAAPTLPLTLTGTNDNKFNVAVNGGAATPVTVAAGTYATMAELAAAVQTGVNSAVGAGNVAVSVDASNRLVVTSNTVGGATAIALSVVGGDTGFASMFGGAATAGNRATGVGSLALSGTITVSPIGNDRFTLALDGGAAVAVSVPPGTYTPATLATALQASLDAAVGVGNATVSLNGSNQLMVSSSTVGGATAATLAAFANGGTGAIAAGTAASYTSMPAADVSLTFRKANAGLSLPDRLTGFPWGTTVTVAQRNGTTTEYKIDPSDSVGDYVPFSAGATVSFNGMSFVIDGAPAEGDGFVLSPNTSGNGDNRNMRALGALQTAKALGDGTTSFQSSYSQMVSLVGNKAREVEVTLTAQENLAQQGRDSVASMSGVNLDEEAANLMRYQQAYQAAAKMMDLSSRLFDLLLDMGR